LVSASSNWQQLSASVDLFGIRKEKKIDYQSKPGEYLVGSITDDPDSTNQVWIISTKWETPILNFKGTSGSAWEDEGGLFFDE
jgi:hypothetical protein